MLVSDWAKRWRSHGAVFAAVLLLGAALVTECSSAPTLQTSLPAGVTVSVFQNRSDFAPRHLQGQVYNKSTSTLTLRSGSFSSVYSTRPVSMR